MSNETAALLREIEKQLDWESGEHWSGKDFEALSEMILDKTGVSLSSSTLRRIWGRKASAYDPSNTSLDALARFAGFENLREFRKSVARQSTLPDSVQQDLPGGSITGIKNKKPVKIIMKWPVRWLAVCLIVLLIFGILALLRPHHDKPGTSFSFTSRPVTRGLPNSVIFNYDAGGVKGDSVFIQQSWDPRTRVNVSPAEHTLTSIYYEPGFYTAKLMVGSTVVKEHALLIPTENWAAMTLSEGQHPVYLNPSSFLYRDRLGFEGENKSGWLRYFNVGNFEPVPVDQMVFTAELKNEWADGSAPCQYSNILLITDAAPIFIPLCNLGCISSIMLRSVDSVISGKTHDLSGFGVSAKDWTRVTCRATEDQLEFLVNDRTVLRTPLPSKPTRVVGLCFSFQGRGAVRGIRLDKKNSTVFSAFP